MNLWKVPNSNIGPMETLTSYFLESDAPAGVRKAFNEIRKQKQKQKQPLLFKPYKKYYVIGPNGKCIHLHGAEDSNGAKISQWDKMNQDNFKWFICPVAGDEGYYHIISASSGKVLHHGAGIAKCTTLKIGPEPNMRVRFERVTDAKYSEQFYYIVFKDSNKCVHNHGGGDKNDADITQLPKIQKPNLYWRFEEA